MVDINTDTISTSIAIVMIFPSFSYSTKNLFFCKEKFFISLCVSVTTSVALSTLITVRKSIMHAHVSKHDKHTCFRRGLYMWLIRTLPRLSFFLSMRGEMCIQVESCPSPFFNLHYHRINWSEAKFWPLVHLSLNTWYLLLFCVNRY